MKPAREHHNHAFGHQHSQQAERRTWWVVVVTLVTMFLEIGFGLATGSMALLADGVHMGSHALALTINALAYWYARRHAFNPDFSFGTGKVNALGGYTGALLLGFFGLGMAWESGHRMLNPHDINFDIAIAVAVVGLVVNALSVLILGGGHSHDHDGDHGHTDLNLRSAYLHVLTDALTSILAIVALLAGKFAGLNWLDPMMGIVGAVLVIRWSVQLLGAASATLLDKQVSEARRDQVRKALEVTDDDTVTDLHLWSVGPGLLAAAVVVLTRSRSVAADYRERLPDDIGLVHATIEVHYDPGTGSKD